MNIVKNRSGFTLLEILVALGIMAIGFLAMSQMQYLSILQTRRASEGTLGTNFIQYAVDRDLQDLRRTHLLNSQVYIDAQADKPYSANPDYCDGTAPASCPESGDHSCVDPCQSCPCDPVAELYGIDTTQDDTQTSCAEIDNVNDFDVTGIRYETNFNNCTDSQYYLVRSVNSTLIQNADPTLDDELDIDITYGLKTQRQFSTDELKQSFTIRDTVAIQNVRVTAHIATDWNEVINSADWNRVVIPNVP